MILHLYTSSKGGVGKTLCGLSTAVNYLDDNLKVLCVDLNWENADLARILRLGQRPKLGNEFSYAPLAGGKGLILQPSVPFTIAGGAIGFWSLLRDALRETINFHRFSPDVVIVDTGLHFANLIRRTSSDAVDRGLQRINEISETFNFNKLNIWFIWTLAAIYGREHIPHIQGTLALLQSGIDEQCFIPKENFIHVINPYAIYPLSSLMRVFTNGLKTAVDREFSQFEKIESLQKLSEAGVTGGLEFDDFVSKILEKVTKKIGKAPTDTTGFLNVFAKVVLSEYDDKRPRNIFPVPIYDSKVVGYTDMFARENPETIRDIKDDITSIQMIISRYLRDLL